MTFNELLLTYRNEAAKRSDAFLARSLIGEQLVMAEQIEANRLAIEELRQEMSDRYGDTDTLEELP